MRKLLLSVAVVLALSLVPMMAFAAEIEGTVQGFTCVTQGKVCPVGQEDPIAAAENVFVVLTATGTYYFVPNVDRAVMARHIAEKVKIVGEMKSGMNAINAESLYSYKNGKWQEDWSVEMMKGIEKWLTVQP